MSIVIQEGGGITVTETNTPVREIARPAGFVITEDVDGTVASITLPGSVVVVEGVGAERQVGSVGIIIQSEALAQGPPGGIDWSTVDSSVILNRDVGGNLISVVHGLKGTLTINQDVDGKIDTVMDQKNGITRQFNRDINGVLISVTVV